MPPLISVSALSKSFGTRTLFNNISFVIEPGERIGLIGPNGAGKSTLLKIIAGELDLDCGNIAYQKGIRIGLLEQVPHFNKHSTILLTILEGAKHPDDGATLALAFELISKLSLETTKDEAENRHAETPISQLSGGWKKRVALARELMRYPDLLLLDEPTNHLDVESILWLEDFIEHGNFATLTITHDRFFLQRVSNRIMELDKRNPDGLLCVKGNYENYLEAKQDLISSQEKLEDSLKNTLRREQEWLRAGVKARTTKQQARIQRADVLKKEVKTLEARNTSKTARIEFVSEGNHPKKLLEAKNLTKAYEGHVLFKDLNILLSPGTRLGLLGPNGCGKSSLIRILLEQEKPDQGSVFTSEHLQCAYFEQNRQTLDPKISLLKTLAPHGDQVIYRGKSVHARGYLDRFLFTQAQMNLPVGQLSGGEQSRLLMAQLMLEEGNLLVLDEPTNDLDLPTLAILEDCLLDFDGAIIFVTHDRFFLDRVATQILAFHPFKNSLTNFFSSLSQWEEWHQQQLNQKVEKKSVKQNSSPKKSKLGYKEQRELDSMEENIQKLETRLALMAEESQLPEIISNSNRLVEITHQMGKIQEEVDHLYTRWGELEKKK